MEKIISAHITGTVWKILVKEGDSVNLGDVLIIFESMKMEIPLECEYQGTILKILVAEETPVIEGQKVIVIQT